MTPNMIPAAIKLKITKQFVEVLDINGNYFSYICQNFLSCLWKSFKQVFLTAPKLKDSPFKNSPNELELKVWTAYV